MKKFYTSIFATVLMMVSFSLKAQIYNSIADGNPNGYTLDDPRFWGGTTLADVPPNTCNGCTIKIYSSVYIVPYQGALPANGGKGTSSLIPGADAPSLNHITLNNSTVNVYGATTLTVNTWLTLAGTSSITIGNDPINVESIFVNDQIEAGPNSYLRLANDRTVINVQNFGTGSKTNIVGPYLEIGNTIKGAGIFGVLTTPIGGVNYTQILESNGIGSAGINGQYFAPGGEPYYTFNCKPTVLTAPNNCDFGLVYGPVDTKALDPVKGVLFGQSVTLPVELVQFLATKNTDGSVKLSWATSQEVNAGYFDVERSGNQTEWAKIGSVKAKGNSSITSNYSFTDQIPKDGSGYYRLKMVDLDGKFKYSRTISVESDNSARPLVVYNNPFTDLIRLKVNVSRAQNLTMTVSDMQGKTFLKTNYQAQLGDNMVNLPSNIGGSGMYILRIQGDSYNQTVKLQKQ